MGKNQKAKSTAGYMIFKGKFLSIKAKIYRKLFLPFCFLCFVSIFAINAFAQNSTDFLFLAEKIRNGSTEEKRDILFQIRNIKTEQASRLAIPALNDESEIIRATATNSVIFLPQNEAAQLLVPLLIDKSFFVRKETAYALGKVKSPQTVNSLLQTLQKDKDLEVKSAAAIALGQIGDISAIDELTKVLSKKLKKKEDFLRRSAARSIGQIAQFIQTQETQSATPEDFLPQQFIQIEKPRYKNLAEVFPVFNNSNNVLIKILQNQKESQNTRREAAFALGEIADEAAISVLNSNVNSDDLFLAEISQRALNKIRISDKNKK